jgi:hypothetical protein
MKLPLLFCVPLAWALCLDPLLPRTPAQSPAEAVRDEIAAFNAAWDEARTSYDVEAFERMLAPDFWVQIGPQKLTRAEFIAQIAKPQPAARLVRFDTQLLTLRQEQGDWYGVITEKLEIELTRPDGGTGRIYSLWVTKDGFRKGAEGWKCLSSEALGWENWNAPPPIPDWSS